MWHQRAGSVLDVCSGELCLEVGREAGAQVEDGEEDVDLLLLSEEVGVGLAQPDLV